MKKKLKITVVSEKSANGGLFGSKCANNSVACGVKGVVSSLL